MSERSRRAVWRAAVVVVIGLALGLLAATDGGRERVRSVAKWLRGPSAWAPMVLTTGAVTTASEQGVVGVGLTELQRQALSGAREAAKLGDLELAQRLVREGRAGVTAQEARLLWIEDAALAIVQAEESGRAWSETDALDAVNGLRSAMPRPFDAQPGSFAGWLEDVPEGLGQEGHAGRAHARAFVAAVIVAGGGVKRWRLPHEALADLCGESAGAAVDVLRAWASLGAVDANGMLVVRDANVRIEELEAFAQWLLAGGRSRVLCDGLAEFARNGSAGRQERVLAAMLLDAVGDVPVGGARWLPANDEGAERWDPDAVALGWERIRDLSVLEAYVERVRIATRHANKTWLMQHVDPPGSFGGKRSDGAQKIAEGALHPEAHLLSLLPDPSRTAPEDVLAVMATRFELRLALHELLTLQEVVPPGRVPTWTGGSQGNGLVIAWRDALGLSDAPQTLRIARLERRLDGVELIDETRRVVAGDTTEVLEWTQLIDGGRARTPTWAVPGTLTPPGGESQFSEHLELRVFWADEGARVGLSTADARIQYPNGSSGSSRSGGGWEARLPYAMTPWDGDDSVASRRTYLVLVEEGDRTGDAWGLDEWRAAVDAAYVQLVARADRRSRQLGPGLSFEEIAGAVAVLRPAATLAAVAEAPITGPVYDKDVSRSLALAGVRGFVEDTAGGQVAPSNAARNLPPREIAELLLDAPDPDVREVMAFLLTSEKPPDVVLARELRALDAAEPGRVPESVLLRVEKELEEDRGRSGWAFAAVAAIVLWGLILLLFLGSMLRRHRPHGARGMATALLGVALVVAQFDVRLPGGTETLPAWAAWPFVAAAVWMIGRGYADRAVRVVAWAALVAAMADALVPNVGLAAEIVSAVAALVACIALAPIAPALMDGLGAPHDGGRPRRARPSAGWGMMARAALGGVAGAAVVGAASQQPVGEAVAVMLLYLPFAACFAGLTLWRLDLTHDRRAASLPLLFVAGASVPAVVLLCSQVADRLAGRMGERALPQPLLPFAMICSICALIFVVFRTHDAARIRGRADASAHGSALS